MNWSQQTVETPHRILALVHLWPDSAHRGRRLAVTLVMAMLGINLVSMVATVATPTATLTGIADTISAASPFTQALLKVAILEWKNNRIRAMLRFGRDSFWSINDASGKLYREARRISRLIVWTNMLVLTSGVFYSLATMLKSLLGKDVSLPLNAAFPFNFEDSAAVYSLVWCLQSIAQFYLLNFSVIGFDFLFIAFIGAAVIQFRQLGQKLREIEATNISELKICIMHHQKLMTFCDDMKDVFAPATLVQFFASTFAICMSAFLFNLVDTTQRTSLFVFCIGHTMQLFIFCSAGSELLFHSNSVATAAYSVAWESSRRPAVAKQLMVTMHRSQRAVQLGVRGLADLTYSGFIAVLKVAFSFYTLMQTISEKRHRN